MKIKLILLGRLITCSVIALFPLFPIVLLSHKVENCDYSKGAWLDIPLSVISSLPQGERLFKNYGNIYVLIKDNRLLKIIDLKENSCHKKYAWYENGLSMNFINEEVEDLVFKKKVDGKYWLDISRPASKEYFLNQFKNLRKEHKNIIHLDDHFGIPAEYGDYRKEVNELAKDLYKIGGKFSLSVLPQQYALEKYNQDWEHFLQQGYLSEIILQNYVEKNFDKNLKDFLITVEKYNANYSIGIYQGEILKPLDIKHLVNSLKSRNINYTVFPFRTTLFQ